MATFHWTLKFLNPNEVKHCGEEMLILGGIETKIPPLPKPKSKKRYLITSPPPKKHDNIDHNLDQKQIENIREISFKVPFWGQ